jgi:hypothetical protein
MKSGDAVNQLLRTRSVTTREKTYGWLAQQYGKSFADSVRDTVEAHHMIVEKKRAINRHGKRAQPAGD